MSQINPTSQITTTILLPPEAHKWAQLFASKQADPKIGQKVYHNTLSVFAVDEYLHGMGIPTELEDSDSWYPGLTTQPDSTELKLGGLGSIECRPVLAEETQIVLPVSGNEIGYVVVQLSAALDSAQLCGYAHMNETSPIALGNLQPIEDLTNYFGMIRDSYDRLEKLDPNQQDSLVTEFLAEVSERETLALLARTLPIYGSGKRELSKKLAVQKVFGSNAAGVVARRVREKGDKELNESERSHEQLEQEDRIRELAAGWLRTLEKISSNLS
jgi:Protein of unknown function (DUF1822)